MNINPILDLLLVKNLEQRNIIESLTNRNVNQKVVLCNHLKQQNEEYLVNFFKLFAKKDLHIKDTIFQIFDIQNTLEKILKSFPEYQKYLLKNKPTEQITIYKSYFNVEKLGIIYHDKFKP